MVEHACVVYRLINIFLFFSQMFYFAICLVYEFAFFHTGHTKPWHLCQIHFQMDTSASWWTPLALIRCIGGSVGVLVFLMVRIVQQSLFCLTDSIYANVNRALDIFLVFALIRCYRIVFVHLIYFIPLIQFWKEYLK